jgi:hypothetical protein
MDNFTHVKFEIFIPEEFVERLLAELAKANECFFDNPPFQDYP